MSDNNVGQSTPELIDPHTIDREQGDGLTSGSRFYPGFAMAARIASAKLKLA